MIQDPSLRILNVMLSRQSKEVASLLKGMLPPSMLPALQHPERTSKDLSSLSLAEIFGAIHPSWYIDFFKTLSPRDQRFYISCFPREKGEELKEHLKIDEPLYTFDEAFSHHFLLQLFSSIFPSEAVPIPLSFLPEDPLNRLALAPYDRLKKCARFLGLYDLAPELKTVIKASILQQLEGAFSDEELKFLRHILKEPKKFTFEPIGINAWNGDIAVLHEVILERGLYRLSLSLKKASPTLVWYILHILDKRESALCTQFIQSEREYAIEGVRGQVMTTWESVCTSSP